MPPEGLSADKTFEKILDVVQQRILPFVDEDGGGGVQGLQMYDAVANAAAANYLLDTVRSINQLHAVICDPVDDASEEFESAERNRGAVRR